MLITITKISNLNVMLFTYDNNNNNDNFIFGMYFGKIFLQRRKGEFTAEEFLQHNASDAFF